MQNNHIRLAWLSALLFIAVNFWGCASPRTDQIDDRVAKDRIKNPEFWALYDKKDALRELLQKEVSSSSMECVEHGVNVDKWYVQEVMYGQITQSERGGSASCGGLISSGYNIPKVWVPGLTVRVRWSLFEPVTQTDHWQEKYTTIPPYAKDGNVYVHFFPNKQVRVVVSNTFAGDKDHPVGFNSTVPPPEHPSHTEPPVAGVNLTCVVHGKIDIEVREEFEIRNPNFSRPAWEIFDYNNRYIRPVYENPNQPNWMSDCRNTSMEVDNVWQPHKTVKVNWVRVPTPEEKAKQTRFEYIEIVKQLAVPQYDHPMDAWLHVFENEEARLVFSDEPPDSPKHPIARNAMVPPPEVP